MRIGIDFDNTIAGYDGVFAPVARKLGLLHGHINGTKSDVRAALRDRGEEGEVDWQRLQGQVYGKYMSQAEMIGGVDEFLTLCRDKGETVFIVSHKTEFGHHDPDRVNLRDAATDWMASHGFFDDDGFGLSKESVFFEPTRKEKVARIKALGCTHFIDDLPEVFLEGGFPDNVECCLFNPNGNLPPGPYTHYTTWQTLLEDLLGATG